jgi:hypothetical protein
MLSQGSCSWQHFVAQQGLDPRSLRAATAEESYGSNVSVYE